MGAPMRRIGPFLLAFFLTGCGQLPGEDKTVLLSVPDDPRPLSSSVPPVMAASDVPPPGQQLDPDSNTDFDDNGQNNLSPSEQKQTSVRRTVRKSARPASMSTPEIQNGAAADTFCIAKPAVADPTMRPVTPIELLCPRSSPAWSASQALE